MTASQIFAVDDAGTLAIQSPDGTGYMLSLLVLADGRVVSLDPSDHDAIYANMAALVRDGKSRGWSFGDLVKEPEMLARYADGYELDGEAVVIGGSDGTH